MRVFSILCGLALMLAVASPARAQSPDWAWTRNMGWPGRYGPNQDVIGTGVTATADGGALVSVNFAGAMNFGMERDTLNALGETDAVLIKYSAGGAKLWTVLIRGLSVDGIGKAETDAQGNIYVAGIHYGTVYFSSAGDFLPGVGGFLAKYTAAGTFVQAVAVGVGRLGFSGVDFSSLHVDAGGDCVMVGQFSGTVTVGGTTLRPQVPGHDAFVARVSGTQGTVTGVLQFSADMGGIGPEIRSSALLPNGDVVIGGVYQYSITFSPAVSLTSTEQINYAVCYTRAGVVRWARHLPLETYVAADPAGQLYAVGSFRGALGLDTLRASSGGGQDVFVARLDATTGAAQGLAYAGGGGGDQAADGVVFSATGLATLNVRNYAAAQFGTLAVPAPSPGFRQFAAVQFSAGWQPQRVFLSQTQRFPRVLPALAPDSGNELFVLANVASPVTFGRFYVAPQGDNEVVLAHTGLVTSRRPAAVAAGVWVYPNPARATVTVQAPAGLRLVEAALFDALGRRCWAGPLVGGGQVPLGRLAPGVYLLRVRPATGPWLSQRLVVAP